MLIMAIKCYIAGNNTNIPQDGQWFMYLSSVTMFNSLAPGRRGHYL